MAPFFLLEYAFYFSSKKFNPKYDSDATPLRHHESDLILYYLQDKINFTIFARLARSLDEPRLNLIVVS